VTAALTLLPRARYRSMAWRNGAGVTQEIARDRPEPDSFQWRLSLATVSHSGSFSNYPGYQRSVTLIDGAGFRLNVAGQSTTELRLPGQSARFPGHVATECALFGGPSTDLSLMVGDPGVIVLVSTQSCDMARTFDSPPGAMQAFFCLAGRVLLSAQNEQVQLGLYDSALACCNNLQNTVIAAQSPACVLVRLVWSLGS